MWILLVMWVTVADIDKSKYDEQRFPSLKACEQALDRLWRTTDQAKPFVASCVRSADRTS